MKGWLTSEHTAYVSLSIHGPDNEYDVVIATGFNGALYLPEETIASLGLQFVSSLPIALADQTTIIVDAFEASVVWFGSSMRVPVLAGSPGCESLLGMEILEGCRIELDAVNAEVRLELLSDTIQPKN